MPGVNANVVPVRRSYTFATFVPCVSRGNRTLTIINNKNRDKEKGVPRDNLCTSRSAFQCSPSARVVSRRTEARFFMRDSCTVWNVSVTKFVSELRENRGRTEERRKEGRKPAVSRPALLKFPKPNPAVRFPFTWPGRKLCGTRHDEGAKNRWPSEREKAGHLPGAASHLDSVAGVFGHLRLDACHDPLWLVFDRHLGLFFRIVALPFPIFHILSPKREKKKRTSQW